MASLERFPPVARAWFEAAFAAPTEAQEPGWDAVSKGDHTLILAPTSSGKTLAAFLWTTLDGLITAGAYVILLGGVACLYVEKGAKGLVALRPLDGVPSPKGSVRYGA